MAEIVTTYYVIPIRDIEGKELEIPTEYGKPTKQQLKGIEQIMQRYRTTGVRRKGDDWKAVIRYMKGTSTVRTSPYAQMQKHRKQKRLQM